MRASTFIAKVTGAVGRDALAAALVMAIYGCWEIRTEGIISEIGGLGGDGTRHVVLAGRVPEAIVNEDTTAYEWRHLLPYSSVYYAFRALGIEYDAVFGRDAIILAHRIQNVLCLVAVCLFWGRILHLLKIRPRIRRLSFALLLLNFAFTKMPFYHPCNGDSTQFLFGVLMLYGYLSRRIVLLVVLAALAFFVRPGADIYALCLLAFQPPRTDEQPLAGRYAHWFLAGCIAIVVLVVAVLYLQNPDRVRTIQPVLGFLGPLSVPIATLAVLVAFRFLLRDVYWQSLLRPRWVALPVALGLMVAARLALARVAAPTGDITNELHIFISCVANAVNKPALPLVAHPIYFGPVVILGLLLWPRVCRQVNAQGPGLTALFAVVVLLGLHSESRLLTTPFPCFAAMVCAALNDMKLPRRFGSLCVLAGLLLSKIWLSMSGEVPWDPLDYPDLLYWIHQGPWMPLNMYVIQGLVVLLLAGVFAGVLYRDRISDLRRWISAPEEGGHHRPLLAAGGYCALRLAGVPPLARIGLGLGWGLAALAVVVVVPRLFATMPESETQVYVQASPAVVYTGATRLTILEHRFGAPSPPGGVEYQWLAGSCTTDGRVAFRNPGQRWTRAEFSKIGTYTIKAAVRYPGRPEPLIASAMVYVRGTRNALPLDINGDGRADILWHSSATGELVVDLMNERDGPRPMLLAAESSRDWAPFLLGDFDGNECADVLWRNRTDGTLVAHLMNGSEIFQRPLIPQRGPSWELAGFGDFDGDGTSDMLWHNSRTHQTLVDTLYGGSVMGAFDFSGPQRAGFSLIAIGDFDGDGRADLLWRDREVGRVRLDTNDLPRLAVRAVDLDVPGWDILACVDFDADGATDILWQHVATKGLHIQYVQNRLRGPLASDLVPQAGDREEELVGVGDFNGDGRPDLLWRHRVTGGLSCRLMHHHRRELGEASTIVGRLDADWRVVALADYNGDGTSDILFQSGVSAEAFIYFMNGAEVLAPLTLAAKRNTDQRVVGPPSDLRFVGYNIVLPEGPARAEFHGERAETPE